MPSEAQFSSPEPTLGKRVFHNSFFSFLDILLTKVGTLLIFVFLVRFLGKAEIATVGIAAGYLVFIAYLEVGATRVLMRDFPKVARDPKSRAELFSALSVFWLLQPASKLMVFALIHFLFLDALGLPGITLVFFALTIDFICLSFQEGIKTFFFANFQQALATRIAFCLLPVRLALYFLFLLFPTLEGYAGILLAVSGVNFVVWTVALIRCFPFRPTRSKEMFVRLVYSLKSYVLWDHGNRMVLNTLLLVGPVILSWFLVPVEEVSDYTIALRVTTLMFIVPFQIQKSLQQALSNVSARDRIEKLFQSAVKVNVFLGLLQLGAMFVFGELILGLLFGDSATAGALHYMLILVVAITILNMVWPFIAVMNNLCELRLAFLKVFLPCLFAGFGLFVAGTWLGGAQGILYASIPGYGLLTLGVFFFVRRNYPLALPKSLLTTEERTFLFSLFRRS